MGFPTVSLAFASHSSRDRISSRARSSRRELCKRFALPSEASERDEQQRRHLRQMKAMRHVRQWLAR
eukprot:1986817-Pyramimonas_sp.AAC.1